MFAVRRARAIIKRNWSHHPVWPGVVLRSSQFFQNFPQSSHNKFYLNSKVFWNSQIFSQASFKVAQSGHTAVIAHCIRLCLQSSDLRGQSYQASTIVNYWSLRHRLEPQTHYLQSLDHNICHWVVIGCCR